MIKPVLHVIDFETFYDDEYSLKKMTTEAYIRDPRFEVIGVSVKVAKEKPVWFSGTMEETKAFLDQFDWSSAYCLAHNTAFDAAILNWKFGIRPLFLLDSMSMAKPYHALTCGVSLDALMRVYGVGLKGTEILNAKGKHRVDFTPEQLAAYGAYCNGDVQGCHDVFKQIARDFPFDELRVIDMVLRMFTEPVLVLNMETLSDHLADVLRRKKELMDSIDHDKSIIQSNPKFADALRELGVEPPMKLSLSALKRGEQKLTYAFAKTDPEFRELLEHEDPRVQALVAARLGTKGTIEETRTKAFMGIAMRGLLPILLNYHGGHTGRLSGGDKVNLQNMPRGGKLRQSIEAPDGHTLVVGDSSNVEARIVAWLAGQMDLVDAFARGDDIYAMFASDIYGYKVTKETHPNERFVGKESILGLGFGMGWRKFKATLKAKAKVDMPDEECRRIVNLYRAKYAAIVRLWRKCHAMLGHMCSGSDKEFWLTENIYAKGNRIYLPNGMFIQYPDLEFDGDQYTYRARREIVKIYGAKVVENVVQALARIVVFKQMESLNRMVHIVLTVHDEIVACVPDDIAEVTEKLMQQEMRKVPKGFYGLPVTCETGRAKSYGKAKK